jgi:hypothetical protein
VLDREVALENLLRVATDETDEVVRADRTAHRHQWLRILLRRLLGLGAELLSWPATEVMSPPSSDGAILLLETYAETISALSSAVLRV